MSLPETVPFLGWAWDDLLFLFFAGALLGTGLMVVIGRNIIRSGLWMICCFGALAGLYVLLGAPLIAAAQVLIYIGAISVLVLFAVMLTQSKSGPVGLVFHHQAWAGALAALGIGILVAVVVAGTAWPLAETARTPSPTEELALLLFRDYVLPLEVVSVLLLAAVIGGVFLAKREREPEETIVPAEPARERMPAPAPAVGTRELTP
ncbi:MAG: NADH-quinone oxidoreductase subunit J [Chloroflexi bacterium]|nr:NADH-quinone oxidoreductase subunit J [Chloroflexota bacterium]